MVKSKAEKESGREAVVVVGNGDSWFKDSKSEGLMKGRDFLGPLFLMTATPLFVNFVSVVLHQFNGEFLPTFEAILKEGLFNFYNERYPSSFDALAWKIIISFLGLAILLTGLLPGPKYQGPRTPGGHHPTYHDNGILYYFTFIGIFLACSQLGLNLYNGAILYEKAPEILAALNILGLAICLVLYIKGHVAPTEKDDTHFTGNFIKDYYVGAEHHTRLFGFDVKQITNCRFGMIWWPVFNISCCFYQYEQLSTIDLPLLVATTIHLVYMFKFFLWEKGYFNSMDMQHDRSGYYLCWGCLVWVPTLYNLPCHFAAGHYTGYGWTISLFILAVGLLSVYLNYDCDRQREIFRKTGGKALVWGKEPKYIVAHYQDEKGNVYKSLLLASGWWGVARHVHYVFEWLAAFSWSPPVYLSVLPYCYFGFLVLLLIDRERRDEARCRGKYAGAFDQYCKQVPYRILPGVY